MTNTLETIDVTTLSTVTGGMKWEQLPRSKNIEDRRSAADKQRDNKSR